MHRGEALSAPEKEELRTLKLELAALKHGDNPQSDLSEESEDEDFDELPLPSPEKYLKSRSSVSAEAFGVWNVKGSYLPKVVEKTPEQRERILKRLCRSFMFSALDEKEQGIVINAMEEREFAPGEQVITQGQDGHELFLVEQGTLECWRTTADEPLLLKVYGPGESFGELALLYNAPRAASIRAVAASVCWVLDRECFTHIVKDAAMRKREKYDEFLLKIKLLEEMDPYERSKLADALQSITFNMNDYVIREGEWGNVFYMVEEGSAVALKTLTPGCPPEEVKAYGPGEYFGELALLKGEPRAASIKAMGTLKCVSLDRNAFKRMLGPLQEILNRNADKYKGYLCS